jgi:hypothetical protein
MKKKNVGLSDLLYLIDRIDLSGKQTKKPWAFPQQRNLGRPTVVNMTSL